MKAFLSAFFLLSACLAQAANLGPWVQHSSGTTNRLNSVAYGNSGFVAVGDDGVIIQSNDGLSWQPAVSGLSETLHAVTFANNLYVAVGAAGKILRSTNGLDWNATILHPEVTWRSIAYGGDRFVIGSGSGSTAISPDTIDWADGGVGAITSVDVILPGFIAGAANGKIYYSTNGLSWTLRNTDPSARPLFGGTFSPVGYVIVGGAGGTTRSALWTSPDGNQWTLQNSTTGFGLNDAAWALNQFIAVGDSGLTATSSQLTGWTAAAQSGVLSLYGITYGNNRFVTVGNGGYVGEKFYSENIVIAQQPQNQSVYPWETARFEVKAIGGLAPLQYQWYKGAAQIPGARSNVLSFEVRDTLAAGPYRVVVSDGFNSVSSDTANLTLVVDFFTSLNSPSPDTSAPQGIPLQFSATIEGSAAITNVIFLNGSTTLGNDTTAPYSIYAALNGLGVHALRAIAYSDSGASSTSAVVNVTVVARNPEITAQPRSQSIYTGTIVKLGSGAAGLQPITYQWLKDGEPLAGATTATLSLNVTNFTQAGIYQLRATGPYGSSLSTPARLEVTTFRPDFVKMFHDHDPAGSTALYNELAFGNGTYVAVGGSDAIATSPDGVEWVDTYHQNSGGGNLYSVIYAQNKFVAVGGSIQSSEFIIASTNGYSWSVKRSPSPAGNIGFTQIAYGNGTFVAVGRTGRSIPVCISTNGEAWTIPNAVMSPLPSVLGLAGVLFHPTLQAFVTYNNSSANTYRFYSSPDGVTWSTLTNVVLGTVNRVDLFGTNFIALTQTGIWTSTDAINWTQRLPDGAYKFGTTVGSGASARFVAYRSDGFRARTSDAQIFTVETTDAPADGRSALWANGSAIMVTGSSGIFGSLDGAAWGPVRANRWRHDILETSFARDRFYLNGTSGIMPIGDGMHPVATSVSLNGIPWTAAYGAGKYVAGAALGTLWQSDNGITFTASPGSSSITRLLYEENKFVGVGDTQAKYSTDGINWQPAISANPSYTVTANDFAYGNGRFVSVHINGGLFYSEDGITWNGPLSQQFSTITYGKGVFAAAALGSNIASYSDDGLTWTKVTLDFSARGMHYADGLFLSFNETSSDLVTSLDGINWYSQTFGYYRGITFGNGIWMITGKVGAIRQTGYGSEFPIPPQIAQEPSDIYLPNGLAGELRVRAIGAAPLRYQWFKDDQSLSNETNSTLQLPGGLPSSGLYYARIENNVGSITTRTAQALYVKTAEPGQATLSAVFNAGQINVTISGANGTKLRLESSETLEPNSWTLLEEIQNPSGTIFRTFNPADHAQLYLRAITE